MWIDAGVLLSRVTLRVTHDVSPNKRALKVGKPNLAKVNIRDHGAYGVSVVE